MLVAFGRRSPSTNWASPPELDIGAQAIAGFLSEMLEVVAQQSGSSAHVVFGEVAFQLGPDVAIVPTRSAQNPRSQVRKWAKLRPLDEAL